jgi:hypothetical protein
VLLHEDFPGFIIERNMGQEELLTEILFIISGQNAGC